MIEAHELTKRYGGTTAVDGVSFTIAPGSVTGFLGPNGAGKSTTMRMVMGLDRPSSGTVTVNGRPYAQHRAPLSEVGALLDAKAVHPGRSARSHLRTMAATHGIPASRVDEVIEVTGLAAVAGKRVGGFSLGMGQRLGIAAALLGDPRVLMFDEPVNGLDPDGIRWIREFMRRLAGEGRTVFVSSHLMSEMEHTADHLIVIGRGRMQADCSVKEFIERNSEQTVTVRTPETMKLLQLLAAKGARVTNDSTGLITVRGATPQQIGDLAFDNQIRVHELALHQGSLEEAFMEMTRDQVEYRAVGPGGPAGPVGPGGPVPPQHPHAPGQMIGAR